MKEILSKLLSKITSGRYFATIAIIFTACKAYLMCLDLVAVGKMSIEVFLGINSAYWTIVGAVITFYFTKDREIKKEI